MGGSCYSSAGRVGLNGGSRAAGLCDVCRAYPQETISGLLSRLHIAEDKLRDVQTICSSCCGIPAAEPVKCESLDCPWLYERKKVENKVEALDVVAELVAELQEAEDRHDEIGLTGSSDSESMYES